MSFQHPRLQEWEGRLKSVFDEIDDWLEDRYGADYPLHPARAARGATANREDDGLFNVGAAYSAGFGSASGPGYVVDVRMSTLAGVDASVRDRLEKEVAELLTQKLPQAFPGRRMEVKRDGGVYKIFGDLSF